MSNYVEDCVNGDALLSDIDSYIDLWHEADTTMSLHEYLGMTKKEYALFVDDEEYLASIIKAHREGRNIQEIIEENLAMSASSDDHVKAARLERWLKQPD